MTYFGVWIECPFCKREILAEETKEDKSMDECSSTHYICEKCKIEIIINEREEANHELAR